MNQGPHFPYRAHGDNGDFSFPFILARLFWSGDIVQFLPCGLDLANEIWDGVSFLFLEDPAHRAIVEDYVLTLHLFHILSCTHTVLLLMDTVQLTLQLSFEHKFAIYGVSTYAIPFSTVA